MQHAIASAPVAGTNNIASVRPPKSLLKVKIASHNDRPVCSHCGQPGTYARSESCPARSRTCSMCHKRNHFASQCRSHGAPAPLSGSSQRRNSCLVADRRQKPQPLPRRSDSAHHVTTTATAVPEGEEEESFVFLIGDHDSHPSKQQSTSTTITIIILNGVTTQAIIDSGASWFRRNATNNRQNTVWIRLAAAT